MEHLPLILFAIAWILLGLASDDLVRRLVGRGMGFWMAVLLMAGIVFIPPAFVAGHYIAEDELLDSCRKIVRSPKSWLSSQTGDAGEMILVIDRKLAEIDASRNTDGDLGRARTLLERERARIAEIIAASR